MVVAVGIEKLINSPQVQGFLAVWEREEYGVRGHADDCDEKLQITEGHSSARLEHGPDTAAVRGSNPLAPTMPPPNTNHLPRKDSLVVIERPAERRRFAIHVWSGEDDNKYMPGYYVCCEEALWSSIRYHFGRVADDYTRTFNEFWRSACAPHNLDCPHTVPDHELTVVR